VYGIVHYSNFLYIPDQNQKRKKKEEKWGRDTEASERRREREQLSKGKLSIDKQRDQYTHTQAIEREIQ
jgi:hypothetical protein